MTPSRAFHEAMLGNYTRAGKETGYWGSYFLREVRKKGGLATAQRMLLPAKSRGVPKGLQALVDAGRIDLSVEATVLLPQFIALFSETELAEARSRISSLPPFTRRRKIEPELNFPDELGDNADLQTVDFVLMYVPVEAALLTALVEDDASYSDAYQQRIILVTTTTLMAVVRMGLGLWTFQTRMESVEQIVEVARKL
jgi:RmuC family